MNLKTCRQAGLRRAQPAAAQDLRPGFGRHGADRGGRQRREIAGRGWRSGAGQPGLPDLFLGCGRPTPPSQHF